VRRIKPRRSRASIIRRIAAQRIRARSANTIAIIWPPDRAPIIVAVYYTESSAPMDARNAIHRGIGGLIAETF
jgi:hypothetical protein